ncbi:MAG: M20 aminoacylase family protein [Lautropia sp.]
MTRYLGAHPAIAAIRAWHGELTAIRRQLHGQPELGFEEHRTGALVAAELERAGVDEIHRGIGRTGLVGVIRGGAARAAARSSRGPDSAPAGGAAASATIGATIGLRADMDALPMQEENGFEHRSCVPGMMHGCGHDGHVTMLLAAARYLAATRRFDGTVHLIFQPGEEGFAGAQAMIEDGLFERFPCDRVFAMHNWPGLPPGKVAVRPGPMMAAADKVTIRIDGRGGHGAHPHLAVDPVVVAAQLITAAQTIVARNVPPLQSAVLSLCALSAGNPGAFSVIPSSATLTGTVRTFSDEVQATIQTRLTQLAHSIAQGFGATAQVDYQRIYPATINSTEEALFAQRVAAEVFGEANLIRDLEPSMGSEDFAFMLKVRPGAYFRIGQGGAAEGRMLHSARYDFNDAILPLGGALFARLAETALVPAAALPLA